METFSLGRAHKLYQRLREHLNTLQRGTGRARRPRRGMDYLYHDLPGGVTGVVRLDVPIQGVGSEEIKENIDRKVQAAKGEFREFEAILTDSYALKEAIFSKNQESGVSNLLSRQEVLTILLGHYEEALREIATAGVGLIESAAVSKTLIEEQRQARKEKESEAFQLEVLVLSQKELEDKARKIRLELNEIDEEIRQKNALEQIEIELKDETRKILGIL